MKIRRVLPFLLLLACAGLACARISPLADRPDWSQLDKYQGSITRADFLYLLDAIYAPGGAWKPFIKIGDTSATIQTRLGAPPYGLRFAPTAESVKFAPRFWRQKSQMAARPQGRPLAGVRIAIDPGHLGGSWAKMEERWFQIGKSKPVTEGDMTLYVAKLLVPRLTALGAQVFLTRTKAGPVTPVRPKSLGKAAVASLAEKEQPATRDAITKESELLFYRVSEIHRRAELINEQIHPDLVVCLHFNAEAWGDEKHPTLVDKNHLHLLVTGAFSGKELVYDDHRFDMIRKLLSRAYAEELAVSEAVAASMARVTHLPPYVYTGGNAIKVGSSPYVWARNLLANRLYDCPVVYVEPYVMNSRAVFARVQEGDYAGLRAVGGRMQRSIYREYADGITAGLVDYYTRTP